MNDMMPWKRAVESWLWLYELSRCIVVSRCNMGQFCSKCSCLVRIQWIMCLLSCHAEISMLYLIVNLWESAYLCRVCLFSIIVVLELVFYTPWWIFFFCLLLLPLVSWDSDAKAGISKGDMFARLSNYLGEAKWWTPYGLSGGLGA